MRPVPARVAVPKAERICRNCAQWTPGHPLGRCRSPKLREIGITERRTRSDFRPCDQYEPLVDLSYLH